METKEEFIKYIKDFVTKNKFGLKFICAVGFILIFGIPLLINFLYFIGKSFPIFVFEWDGSDVYLFYGTLLGATATIIAVVLTIKSSSESAKKDRKNSIVINHRNEGIKACYDLIEVCNYAKIIDLLNSINVIADENTINIDNEKATLYNKFTLLSHNIKICHIRWQFIYPYIEENTRNYIDDYIIRYQKLLETMQGTIKYFEKRFLVDKDIFLEIMQYQETNEANFIGVLQRLAHEYDCELIWEHPLYKNNKTSHTQEKSNLSKDN